MYVHLIHPQHKSMLWIFDDHDLDERYQFDSGHSFNYERVLHVYDDPQTVNLGTMIGLED